MSLSLLAMALLQARDPLAPLVQPQQTQTTVQQPVTPPPMQTRAPLQLPAVTPGNALLAIDAGNWPVAQALVDRLDERDPIEASVRAELYLASGSPEVAANDIVQLVQRARELPQADQLARLAQRRGAAPQPIVSKQAIVSLGAAPRRRQANDVQGDAEADRLRALFTEYIDANQPEPMEGLYWQSRDLLTPEGRGETAQRAAWVYYLTGRDAEARRMAVEGRTNGSGEWAARSAWVEGLAAWRQKDCNTASAAFRWTALGTRDAELAAAGHYWSARAEQMCGRPQEVAPRMRAAAVNPESFYGQVARETLGMDKAPPRRVERPDAATQARVEALPNVRRAIELAGIGRRFLAEELLKHQAAIGNAVDQPALIDVAKKLSLGGAQYWLATNGQRGTRVDVADRYPSPSWQPDNGWRIDPLLAYAHIIQESDFRPQVVSPADAVGLMQVRPGTAGDTARRRGQSVTVAQLKVPETNLDHGQEFIQQMRADRYFQDQLPRIVAAYNAGPLPVRRWNGIPDGGDPLLWMESLPYWETRFYVPSVLRNYFVYHALAGNDPPALKDIAEHRWPTYPAQ